ncbi:MAG: hypothetical protein LBG16_01670 [Elusimicrobiota bacterium]|jgi:hypothetical protein|nr:hypothetical protein [Elusimicrobiota bacterium]
MIRLLDKFVDNVIHFIEKGKYLKAGCDDPAKLRDLFREFNRLKKLDIQGAQKIIKDLKYNYIKKYNEIQSE